MWWGSNQSSNIDMRKNRPNIGFTLIELLVVISIIAILASLILVAANSTRSKARDAKRIADNKQIMTALELYFSTNSTYPTSGGATNGANVSWNNSTDASWATLQTALSLYMPTLPVDPTNQAGWAGYGQYGYSYFACARAFMLVYKLENPTTLTSPGVNVCGVFYNYAGTVTIGQGSN